MGPEYLNETKERKTWLIITGSIILIFLVYLTIMGAVAPVKKIRELRNDYGYKPDEKSKFDERLLTDSSYLVLYKEKALLQSLIYMAGTDSIYLFLNLPDSTIEMVISGVVVHSAVISRLRVSKILKTMDDYTLSSILSGPLMITQTRSSIQKEPLMIKMAPKDTSEYIPDIIPDTADFEPVNFILEADNGIRVYVYQEEMIRGGDGVHIFSFDLKDRIRNSLAFLKSVFLLKVPEYHPYIKMRIPRSDAKIFYRAVPVNGQFSIRL